VPRYKVTVAFTQQKEKEIAVFAKDAESAMEKAEDIVGNWDGVDECEATDCVEE